MSTALVGIGLWAALIAAACTKGLGDARHHNAAIDNDVRFLRAIPGGIEGQR